MKFKFNWGWGIAIFYSTFVIVMLSFVFYSTTLDNTLDTDDYYDQGVKYQERIDRINRSNMLSEQVKINQINGSFEFVFPITNPTGITGTIEFFRPSNDKLDKLIDFKLDSGNIYSLESNQFAKGFWIVKIPWMHNDSSYYYQEELLIR